MVRRRTSPYVPPYRAHPLGRVVKEVSVVSVLGVLATSFNGVKKMSKNSFVSQAPSGTKGRVLTLPGTTVARTGGGTTTSEDPDEAPEEKPVEPAENAEVGAGAYLIFSPEDSGTSMCKNDL